ncbi:MAG TPA: hypothetical protein VGJ94_10840 [Syntrophorhabdaceae bacterium]|jgi:hypothetical protein
MHRKLVALAALLALLTVPFASFAKEAVQEWTLVNPEGVVNIPPMKLTAHPSTLDGKTIVLQWNGKTNGDNFMATIEKMLTQQFKNIKIIKAWELAPELKTISQGQAVSQKIADKIASMKPDLVISTQAD